MRTPDLVNVLLQAASILGAYLVGFVAAIPPAGPIAVLIAEQAADGDHRRGFQVGLGAALVESAYAYAAVAFFSLMSAHLHELRSGARVAVAVVLPLLGFRFLFSRTRPPREKSSRPGGLWLGMSIAAITPTPLVMWTTVVTLFDARGLPVRGLAALLFGLAAAGGVFSWNSLLVEILKRSGGVLPQARMRALIRGLGVVLIVLGVWSAIRLATLAG